jgi:hypothetical protein
MTDEPIRPELSDADCEALFSAPSPGASPLDDLLSAMRVADDAPIAGEAGALSAFRELHTPAPVVSAKHRRPVVGRFSGWAAALGITGGLLVAGGAAAAATGHFTAPVTHFFDHLIGRSTHPASRPGEAPSVLPTPSAPQPTPSPTSFGGSVPPGAGLVLGTHSHPAHPSRPAHPRHPAHPSKSAHPSKKPHPTAPAHPSHPAHPTAPVRPTHPTHPTKRPHPSTAATPSHSPRSKASPHVSPRFSHSPKA